MKRFGLEGIERLVEVERPNGRVILLPRIDSYVEVPTSSSIKESELEG